jgi:uncharacterized protein
MVEDQAKVSFETGYGLEGILPDALCMRIIQQKILPYMRESRYGEGLLQGVLAVQRIVEDPAAAREIYADRTEEAAADHQSSRQQLQSIVIIYLVISLLVLVVSLRAIRNSRKTVTSDEWLTPFKKYQQLANKPGKSN